MLTFGNDRLSLTLAPDYGARVVALTDRATQRQWLVGGALSPQTGEDARYGADEACGWDECFPTVSRCSHSGWGGRLRDHGLLWGRKWTVLRAEADCIETCFQSPQFRFARTLTLRGASVTADYAVTNLAAASLPYLWSQHCLLATAPGDRIILQGQGKMLAADRRFDWPYHPARDLSAVGAISEGFAAKVYAETPGSASASILGANGGIRFDWNDLPSLGLWLCYGGWPAGGAVHQVALEPTTATADHLNAAEALGQARLLNSHDTHRWSVRLTLTGAEERNLQ